MPIFEYTCRECGELFETLRLGPKQSPPVCPACGSRLVEQMFSTFSTAGTGPKAPGGRTSSGAG
jgi:putative FmdB family regulatory protein